MSKTKQPKRLDHLSVQERFVPLVRKGKKYATIRAKRKDGACPYAGDVIPIYTSPGNDSHCWVADVQIEESLDCEVGPDGLWLPDLNLFQSFADVYHEHGFDSADEMSDWFAKHHPQGLVGWMCSWEVVQLPGDALRHGLCVEQ